MGGLGLSWGSVSDLGLLSGPCDWSWAALGAFVGGVGPLLDPLWGVLGCFLGLGGRSWAAPGALVDNPGVLLGPM